MRVGNLTEIDKRALIILGDAITGRIHTADLPLCREMSLIGRVFKRAQRLRLVRALGHTGGAARTRHTVVVGIGRRIEKWAKQPTWARAA